MFYERSRGTFSQHNGNVLGMFRERKILSWADELNAAIALQQSLNTAGSVSRTTPFIAAVNAANVESVYREMESRGSDRIGPSGTGPSVASESEPRGADRVGPEVGRSVMPSRSVNYGPYGPFNPNWQFNAFDARYRPSQSAVLRAAAASFVSRTFL